MHPSFSRQDRDKRRKEQRAQQQKAREARGDFSGDAGAPQAAPKAAPKAEAPKVEKDVWLVVGRGSPWFTCGLGGLGWKLGRKHLETIGNQLEKA